MFSLIVKRKENEGGAPTLCAISTFEASEDSKARENKKTLSVEAQSPDVSTKTNQLHLLFRLECILEDYGESCASSSH